MIPTLLQARPETPADMLRIVRQERPMSLRQLYRLIGALGIRTIGQKRQKPAYYPPGSGLKVLGHLGFMASQPEGERIVSLSQLRKEKAMAGRGRR